MGFKQELIELKYKHSEELKSLESLYVKKFNDTLPELRSVFSVLLEEYDLIPNIGSTSDYDNTEYISAFDCHGDTTISEELIAEITRANRKISTGSLSIALSIYDDSREEVKFKPYDKKMVKKFEDNLGKSCRLFISVISL